MTQGGGRAGRDDFCYRHPDRQSFVICQRCARTVCGECQTPAAVGVVCPECMREQRASAPRAPRRSLLAPRGGKPSVTRVLIIVNVALYVLQLLPGIGRTVTEALIYAGVYSLPGTFEPWRMITATFLHSTNGMFGFLHIGLNMYTLWIFGNLLEPMIGRARFLLLYLASGVAGSLAVFFLTQPMQPVVGASGAIFGMLGAFIVIQRRLGSDMTSLLVLVGLNFVFGLMNGGISWQAHLGGLIGGAVIGLILVSTRHVRQQKLQIGLLTGFGALLVLLSASGFLLA